MASPSRSAPDDRRLSRVSLLFLLAAWLAACAGPDLRLPHSDHYDGDHFFTPGAPQPKGFGDVLKWMFSRQHGPWRDYQDFPPGPKPPERVADLRVVLAYGGGCGVPVLLPGSSPGLLFAYEISDASSERSTPVSVNGGNKAFILRTASRNIGTPGSQNCGVNSMFRPLTPRRQNGLLSWR